MNIGDLLSGGGAFLKWENPGTTYTGTITKLDVRQGRKYKSNDLDTWDDGTPKLQLLITLATDYRDSANPDDDGERVLSVNLWSGQKKAMADACRALGVKEPAVGMTITAKHVSGLGTADKPRVFEYTLSPAPSGVAAVLDAPESAAAPAAPAAPAVPGKSPAETAKELLAAGLDVADVAKATGLPLAACAALKNTLAA